MEKHYKKIYAFIGDPFNKRYIEQALVDIPHEYRFNYRQNCAMYKLKKPRTDGLTFIHNLSDVLHENGVKMGFSRNVSNGGRLMFYDEAFYIAHKKDNSADQDTVV